MATQYTSPPDSLSYGDGRFNTVPNHPGMLWHLRKISGMSKETIKITPSSGQGSYPNNSKITVSLPMNSLGTTLGITVAVGLVLAARCPRP